MESKTGPAGEVVRARSVDREMAAARRLLRSGSSEADEAAGSAADALRAELAGEREKTGALRFPRRPRD